MTHAFIYMRIWFEYVIDVNKNISVSSGCSKEPSHCVFGAQKNRFIEMVILNKLSITHTDLET